MTDEHIPYDRLEVMFNEAAESLARCVDENEKLHRAIRALEEQLEEIEIQRDTAVEALQAQAPAA